MKIFCLLKLFAKKRIGFTSVLLGFMCVPSNLAQIFGFCQTIYLVDVKMGASLLLFLVGWQVSNLWRKFYAYKSRDKLSTLQGLYL